MYSAERSKHLEVSNCEELAWSRVSNMAHGGVTYIWTIAARAETRRRPSLKPAPPDLKLV